MTLYFAYGSNMHRGAMAARCPTAVAIGTARMSGWRFLITTRGYASIAPAAGSVVYGVLWRLTPRDIAALNAYEALDSALYVRRFVTVERGPRTLRALAYLGCDRSTGRPKPGYLQRLVVAPARAWGLPPRYIAELARWDAITPRPIRREGKHAR